MAQDTDQVEYTPEHPPSIQGVLQESQKHLLKTYPDTRPKQELPHEQQQQDILDMDDAKDGDLLRCLTQKLAQTSISVRAMYKQLCVYTNPRGRQLTIRSCKGKFQCRKCFDYHQGARQQSGQVDA